MPQLLNPIEEPQPYIDDDRYLAQEKKDGERRLVERDEAFHTKGFNRKGNEVSLQGSIIKSINNACVLDAEIVGEKLYVFDIISLYGKSLKDMQCVARIQKLNDLTFGDGIEIVKTAFTKAQKQKMYDELKKNNAEGIVFKRKDSVYMAGRPASFGSALKFKFQKSGTFIVANITKGKRSVGMEVIDGEKRVFVGKVSVPVNHELPGVGSLIEVQYLYGYKEGSLFQPVYRGVRVDLDIIDCTIKQIVYKSEGE